MMAVIVKFFFVVLHLITAISSYSWKTLASEGPITATENNINQVRGEVCANNLSEHLTLSFGELLNMHSKNCFSRSQSVKTH